MQELSFSEAIFSPPRGGRYDCICSIQVCRMKKTVVLLNVLVVFLSLGHAQTSAARKSTQQEPASTPIMRVDEVRPGMKGVGYTVFQGTQPESMGVVVLGVLRNLNGPKSDVVLV